MGEPPLAGKHAQQELRMGCNFAPASRALADACWEIEIRQRVSGRKLNLLRNWHPSVRASSRDWPMALFSFSAERGADYLLRSPAFGDASCGYLCARLARGRSSLLSIIPCRLGHFLRSCTLGISLAAHPRCSGLGNGHSFHHDYGLALLRRCSWWTSSRCYFDRLGEASHATNGDHPPQQVWAPCALSEECCGGFSNQKNLSMLLLESILIGSLPWSADCT